MTARAKEYRFPVEVEWVSGRSVRARVDGKPTVAVATPPEFDRNADPSVWSPEDLLGASAASCLAVGIARIAEREELPLHGLTVSLEGVVGLREDGRFGFTRIVQVVELDTEPGLEALARSVVERAEAGCLVAASLDVPVETRIEIRAAVLL